MTTKNSKILLAAIALGLAALACSGSAEARPKDKGYSDQVVASDDVAPRHHARRHRRHNCDASADCGDDYFFANGYVEPGYDPPPDYLSPAFPATGYKYGFNDPAYYYPAPLVYAPPVLSTPQGGYFPW